MFRLHILGAGTPTPSAKRFGTCYIAALEDGLVMFDCGPASTYKMALMGLRPTNVSRLFFSHHHFDHNADYPCFLLSRWDQAADKCEALKVYGPPPTARVTEALIGTNGAFYPDWQARVEHPGSLEIFQARGGELPRRPPEVEVREIKAGDVVSGQGWQVLAGRARHIDPWMPTLAFRLEARGVSLTITSDTGACQGIVDLARGCDYLLIHCWDLQERMRPAEAGMITGTTEAAETAVRAGARKLLLSHMGPHLDQPAARGRAADDVAGIFKGEVEFLEELTTLVLE